MSTHPSLQAGSSQCELILRELQLMAGEWVAMPRLVCASGSYNVHSRIADLRKRGHTILHENRRKRGSTVIQSFYQLVSPSSDQKSKITNPQSSISPTSP